MLMRLLLAVCSLPLLTGCLPLQYVMYVDTATTPVPREGDPIINGNTEDGYWFDHDLFHLHVTSLSLEESQRVALETATNSCAKRGKTLKITKSSGGGLGLLASVGRAKYFISEIDFRCEMKSVEKPG